MVIMTMLIEKGPKSAYNWVTWDLVRIMPDGGLCIMDVGMWYIMWYSSLTHGLPQWSCGTFVVKQPNTNVMVYPNGPVVHL